MKAGGEQGGRERRGREGRMEGGTEREERKGKESEQTSWYCYIFSCENPTTMLLALQYKVTLFKKQSSSSERKPLSGNC